MINFNLPDEFLLSMQGAVDLISAEKRQQQEKIDKQDEQAYQIALAQVSAMEESRREAMEAERQSQKDEAEQRRKEEARNQLSAQISAINRANGYAVDDVVDLDTGDVIQFGRLDTNAPLPKVAEGENRPDFLAIDASGKVQKIPMGAQRKKGDKKETNIWDSLGGASIKTHEIFEYALPENANDNSELRRSNLRTTAVKQPLVVGKDFGAVTWRKDDANAVEGLNKLLTLGFGEGGVIKDFIAQRNEGYTENYNAYIQAVTRAYARVQKKPQLLTKIPGGKSTDKVMQPLIGLMIRNGEPTVAFPLLRDEEVLADDEIIRLLSTGISESVNISPQSMSAQMSGSTTGPDPLVDENFKVNSPKGDFRTLKSWAGDGSGGYVPEVARTLNNIASHGTTLMPETVYSAFNSLAPKEARYVIEQITKAQEHFSVFDNAPISANNRGVTRVQKAKLFPEKVDVVGVINLFNTNPEVQIAVTTAMFGGRAMRGFPGTVDSGLTIAKSVATQMFGEKTLDAIETRDASASGIVQDVKLLQGLMSLQDPDGNFIVDGGITGKGVVLTSGIASQFSSMLRKVDSYISSVDNGNTRFGGTYQVSADDLDARKKFREDSEEAIKILEEAQKSGTALNQDQFEKLFRAVSQGLLYKVASALQGGDFRNISDYDVRLAVERMGGLTDSFTNIRSAWGVLSQLANEASKIIEINSAINSGDLSKVSAASAIWQASGYASIAQNQRWLTTFVEVKLGGETLADPQNNVPVDEKNVPFAGGAPQEEFRLRDMLFKDIASMPPEAKAIYDKLEPGNQRAKFMRFGIYPDDNGMETLFNLPQGGN